MKVINPFNNKVIGEITLLNRNQVFKKVDHAMHAKSKMRQLSSGDKSKILNQIIEGIQDDFEDFVELLLKKVESHTATLRVKLIEPYKLLQLLQKNVSVCLMNYLILMLPKMAVI